MLKCGADPEGGQDEAHARLRRRETDGAAGDTRRLPEGEGSRIYDRCNAVYEGLTAR
jgi:hypothetical protein